MTDQSNIKEGKVNKPLFIIAGGFIALFCIVALVRIATLSGFVVWGFNFAATYFGLYWQVLLFTTFLMSIVLCVLPGRRAIMGGLTSPEFTTFQWGSLILLPSLWDALRITFLKGARAMNEPLGGLCTRPALTPTGG